jgi:uncharacterized protein YbbK (DUF523 family)
MDTPLRIGISACLVGQEVRFDGGHKRDRLLMEIFGPDVQWVTVCPEVEVGMSTPREPLRLERDAGRVRMVTVETRVDYTERMEAWSRKRLAELSRLELDAYVLKSDSPSCGKDGVKLFDYGRAPSREGTGLFARALMAAMPLLPVEDEARFRDPDVRKDFLARIGAYRESRGLRARPDIEH